MKSNTSKNRGFRPATPSLAIVVWLLMLVGSHAGSWWNTEWSIRKKFVIDTGASGSAVSEPIGTAAVLVRLHDGVFQFGAAKEDGSDIRFVAADDKTLLTFHLEKYDGLLSEAYAWVKVPDIKPGAQTSFYLYYGNQSEKASKVENGKETFPAETVLVYHFIERGSPASDMSGNNNSTAAAAMSVENAIIGGGAKLDGKSMVTIPASPSLQWTAGSPVTFSLWAKAAVLQPAAVICSRTEGNASFLLGLDNGIPFLELSGQRAQGAEAWAAGSWHHLAVVAESAKTTLFVDGNPVGTIAAGVPALNSPFQLGDDGANGRTGFMGEIDEVGIAKVAHPVGWVHFAAKNQGSDKESKLLTFSEDEVRHSWLEGGHFGIIIKNLTFDGWVVIVLLIIMAAISWWVMVTKAGYLNKTTKANAAFMSEWAHVASDLTVLDNADPSKIASLGGRVDAKAHQVIRNGSVFRLYHVGVEEIRSRLANRRDGRLSPASIPAIRASLDGTLVREMEKLNSGMVMLTIAISGGPFLGLLGTVVGVMITFAAIAAAGDVNVNSIAPGIAAALLATVAGLAVAIPALFGYNYLLTRVKGATGDMHVFIDEFITRMAEFYCGDRPNQKKSSGSYDEEDDTASEMAGTH